MLCPEQESCAATLVPDQAFGPKGTERAADSSLTIAKAQYENGVVPFLDVLSAESALLDAQNQVIQSRLALGQAGVSLYKALGGDWQETP